MMPAMASTAGRMFELLEPICLGHLLRRGVQRLVVELDRVGVHRAAYFTLDGSDYPSHAAQEAAIAGYTRWASRRAKPKRRIAVDSKIRRPDYLLNVA